MRSTLWALGITAYVYGTIRACIAADGVHPKLGNVVWCAMWSALILAHVIVVAVKLWDRDA